MEITVTGRHLEVTSAIRDYATQKANKLARFYNKVQAVDVIVAKADKLQFEIEMKVQADGTSPFVAKVSSEDLYAGIDLAVDKLERQLTDHKNKLRAHKGNTSMAG